MANLLVERHHTQITIIKVNLLLVRTHHVRIPLWSHITILVQHIASLPNEGHQIARASHLYQPAKVSVRLDANVRRKRNVCAHIDNTLHTGRPWIARSRYGFFKESRIVADAHMRLLIGLRIVLVRHSCVAQPTHEISIVHQISRVGKSVG